MAAETETEGNVVLEHHEVCFSPVSTSFTSGYMLNSVNLTDMEATSVDFKLEVVNVTQSNTTTDISAYDISWKYFEMGNDTILSAEGDHATFHLDQLTGDVNVLWSISIASNNSTAIDGLCVDGTFEIHVPEEHHAEEADPILGTLAITLLITLLVPGAVAMAFVKFS